MYLNESAVIEFGVAHPLDVIRPTYDQLASICYTSVRVVRLCTS